MDRREFLAITGATALAAALPADSYETLPIRPANSLPMEPIIGRTTRECRLSICMENPLQHSIGDVIKVTHNGELADYRIREMTHHVSGCDDDIVTDMVLWHEDDWT